MGRSPGFGSNPINLRPVKTRFRYGYVTVSLNPLTKLTHRLIIQKARRHPTPTLTYKFKQNYFRTYS
jgi:hypothetical protein